MVKAILTLASHDYPLWTVDEDSGRKNPGLPAYIQSPEGFEDLLDAIQREYDSYFVLDGEALEFKGFANEEERDHLAKESYEAERILKSAVGDSLMVENRIPSILMLAPVKKAK